MELEVAKEGSCGSGADLKVCVCGGGGGEIVRGAGK